MSDLEQARSAKRKLKRRLGHPRWLAGLGLAKRNGAYVIKVNVAELPDPNPLPNAVDNVGVVVEEVGKITPRQEE